MGSTLHTSRFPRRCSSSALSSESQPYSGVADRSLLSIKSLTAISASDTGEEAPLVQLFNSVRNNDSPSSPASCTASFRSAASRVNRPGDALSALTSAKRQSLNAKRRRIDAVTKLQIVGSCQGFEHRKQVASDRHLAYRIGDFSVLDPEPRSPATVIAGDAIDTGADQVGHVKSLLDVGHQLGRGGLSRF